MNLQIVRQQLEKSGNKIAQAITAADWALLSELLSERQQYLENIFSDAIPEAERVELKNLIQTMLAKDEQWIQVIDAQKKQLHQKIQALNQGKKSIQMYWNNE